MAVLIAVLLLINLIAVVISIASISYATSESKRVKDNISKLFSQHTYDITSVATAIESNMSQLRLQLDAVNRLAISVQAEMIRLHCGVGEWYRVAYLDMNDPLQQCPSAWRELNFTPEGIRVCARPNSSEGSCPGVLYPANSQYSKVCGRIIGYQFDAFVNSITGAQRILTILIFNMEEQEVLNMTAAQEIQSHQQAQIKEHSTGTSERQVQDDIRDTLKVAKKCLISMAVLIAVLLISTAAVVLSIASISYAVPESEMVDSQINLLKNQHRDSISKLLTEFNNNTMLIKNAISQLRIQLVAINRSIPIQVDFIGLHCGVGLWHLVAHLNMSDSLQQCPPAWRN